MHKSSSLDYKFEPKIEKPLWLKTGFYYLAFLQGRLVLKIYQLDFKEMKNEKDN
jgi:hypothetical protein